MRHIFIILCFPLLQAQQLFPTEVQYLMYGNMWNMRKTFLPMSGVGFKDGETIAKPNISMAEALSDSYMIYNVDEILDVFNTTNSKDHDEHEYNQINFKVLNLTRNTRKWSYVGYWGWNHYDWSDSFRFSDTINTEVRKKEKLEAICLTYLIHTRYLVDGAMKQRAVIRDDKRYKIGYLFNRLRRLKTEMLKMVRMNHESHLKWETASVMLIIRVYEEVLRMDMDIRDTMWEIRDLYEKFEAYDFQDGASGNSGNPDVGGFSGGTPGI